MSEIIEDVRAYRQAGSLEQRVTLGEALLRRIEPDLRYFVFNSSPFLSGKDDLCQEVLLAITTGLIGFRGNTSGEFWQWCYQIARNKRNEQFRNAATEAKYILSTPPDELWILVEDSQDSALSPQDRADFNAAIQLLINAKPDCYEYLWQHFILGQDYGEIAAERELNYDGVRMKIGRCLETAQALIA